MTAQAEFINDSIIGEGGMGRVYRARQVALDRWVALKVLTHGLDNPSLIERFYREARSAARLVHPNIVQIYTVGEMHGIPYFAMEYVEGDDLEHLIAASPTPLTVDETVEILRSVVKALVVAGEKGIVHRDLKPGNIMITKTGLVKVMDFGLAKELDHSMTQSGMIIGTPGYMSPEQGAGSPVDSRSDLYSVGCVIYECLTSRQPFTAPDVAAIIYKHRFEPPPPMRAANPGVPPEFERLVFKLMAKDPGGRFQTPMEVLEALTAIPSNPTTGELSLAKRAVQRMRSKQSVAVGDGVPAKPGVSATPLPFSAPKKPSPPAQHKEPKTGAPTINPTRAMAATEEERFEQGLRHERLSNPPQTGMAAKHQSAIQQQQNAARARRTTKFIVPFTTPVPRSSRMTPAPFTPLDSPSSGSPPPGSSLPAAPKPGIISDSVLQNRMTKIHDIFTKLADGKWSYEGALWSCKFAEGLAQELPPQPLDSERGLGDCLLCSNWNKRVGCALAATQELRKNSNDTGFKLLVEECLIWAGAGRYDRAIEMLDEYVRFNPDDPEGYRALARIYDKPEYTGRDKRRAIVLYQRFAELAKQKGNASDLEVARAEDRARQLATAPSKHTSSPAISAASVVFQSFYRGTVNCFCLGVLTREKLLISRAGEIDPDSGVAAAEFGGAVSRATAMFKRMKTDSPKEEPSAIRNELARLSSLSYDALAKDPSRIVILECAQINHLSLDTDESRDMRCLTVRVLNVTHQLLFPKSSAFFAEKCYALLRRALLR